MDDQMECVWYQPAQHRHSERLFEFDAMDLRMLTVDGMECGQKLFDFVMLYVYSEWMAVFKERVFIFSALFDLESDKDTVARYPLLFETDFVFIPRLNRDTKCWKWCCCATSTASGRRAVTKRRGRALCIGT